MQPYIVRLTLCKHCSSGAETWLCVMAVAVG